MIINLNQFGNGGGSGPVDVPIATTGRTGVVKIGQGINVDSAGTISVSGVDIEQNYVVVRPNESVELESGKMYSYIDNGSVSLESASGTNELHLMNNGAIVNFEIGTNEDNYEFNPFFGFGKSAYIDIYVNSNSGLSVNYYDKGDNYVIQNEP